VVALDRDAKIRLILLGRERERRREEEAQRRAHDEAIDSFAAFVRLVCSWDLPALEMVSALAWSWYLDHVCDAMERVAAGKTRLLVINLPPGHMKSLVVSVLWQAWIWLRDPSIGVINVSSLDRNVSRDSRKLRAVIGSPQYGALMARAASRFGYLPWGLSDEQNQKMNFVTDAGGAREGITYNAGATGMRRHYMLLDDPMDAGEAAIGSAEQIMARCLEVQEIWRTKLGTRWTHGAVCIAQRLHDYDLPGLWLTTEIGVEIVCFPLRGNPDHPHRHPADNREPGELLSPETLRATNSGLEPEQAARALEARLSHQAPAQLGQLPRGRDGSIFVRPWFQRRYRQDPHQIAAGCDEVAISADLSVKGKASSDPVSIQVWGRVAKPLAFILLHSVDARMGWIQTLQTLRDLRHEWSPSLILVEDKASGPQAIETLSQEIPGVVPYSPGNDDKATRARVVTPVWHAGNVVLPENAPWINAWIEEHLAFTGISGGKDDRVDASSQILRHWAIGDTNPAARAKAKADALARASGRR
jgi:predicted phage terminase large subunit-like protein